MSSTSISMSMSITSSCTCAIVTGVMAGAIVARLCLQARTPGAEDRQRYCYRKLGRITLRPGQSADTFDNLKAICERSELEICSATRLRGESLLN